MLFCAFLWGITFVAQRLAAQHMGGMPFTFNAARFLIGAIILAPFVMRTGALAKRTTWISGIAAGAAMVAGASLQQAAMESVSAGTAGFITGTYVIWVPLMGLFLGHRVSMRIWIAVALALAGLWFLCGEGGFMFTPAELLLVGCAFAWGIQVHVIGWAAARADVFGVSFIQFLFTAVVCGGVAAVAEPVSIDALRAGAGPIVFAGVFAIAIAFTLQIVAQRSAPASHAAIIFSLESVFAELAGSFWMGEGFGARKWLGAGLILAGALAATVTGFRPRPRGSAPPKAPAAD
ncbi:MAG: DMT family transporter [Phycisphaerales bacterium]|nr:DMT family transporter [Phycisphaerales bacterium]